MIPGESLKRLRERKGLTQTEVADFIGVKTQAVSKYENNVVTEMPTDRIEKMAVLFNVTPAYLMGWEAETLEPMEETMLDTFRKMKIEEQTIFLKLMCLFVKDGDKP